MKIFLNIENFLLIFQFISKIESNRKNRTMGYTTYIQWDIQTFLLKKRIKKNYIIIFIFNIKMK